MSRIAGTRTVGAPLVRAAGVVETGPVGTVRGVGTVWNIRTARRGSLRAVARGTRPVGSPGYTWLRGSPGCTRLRGLVGSPGYTRLRGSVGSVRSFAR